MICCELFGFTKIPVARLTAIGGKGNALQWSPPSVERKIAGAENVIMESNSVIRFLRPDLYLTVLDADTEDFKDSAREFLDRADAVVLHQSDGRAKWKTVSMDALAGKPIFKIQPPPYVTEEITAFVREKLLDGSTGKSHAADGIPNRL